MEFVEKTIKAEQLKRERGEDYYSLKEMMGLTLIVREYQEKIETLQKALKESEAMLAEVKKKLPPFHLGKTVLYHDVYRLYLFTFHEDGEISLSAIDLEV